MGGLRVRRLVEISQSLNQNPLLPINKLINEFSQFEMRPKLFSLNDFYYTMPDWNLLLKLRQVITRRCNYNMNEDGVLLHQHLHHRITNHNKSQNKTKIITKPSISKNILPETIIDQITLKTCIALSINLHHFPNWINRFETTTNESALCATMYLYRRSVSKPQTKEDILLSSCEVQYTTHTDCRSGLQWEPFRYNDDN